MAVQGTARWIQLNVAIGVLLFVSARLGMALAIGSSSVTAIWPVTGIALAGAMTWGWRVLPAIVIGTAAGHWANLGDLQHTAPQRVISGTALLTAVSVLQVLVMARSLLRRPQQLRLHPTVGTLTFIAGAGLICLVTAVTGIRCLQYMGTVPRLDAGYMLLTWWISDWAGVLMLAPPLVLWGHPVLRKDPLSSLVFPILSIGVGLTLTIYVLVGALERSNRTSDFHSFSRNLALEVDHLIALSQRDLETLRTPYYNAQIDPGEFAALALPRTSRSPWIESFAWLSRQTDGGAVQFIFRWSDAAAFDGDGRGSDDLANPLLNPAVKTAYLTGEVSATPPFPHPNPGHEGVLVRSYVPVLDRGVLGMGGHQPAKVRGLVSMTTNLSKLVPPVSRMTDLTRVQFDLFDPAASGLLGVHWDGRKVSALFEQAAAEDSTIQSDHPVRIADRQLLLRARPIGLGAWLIPSWLQLGVLLGGCGFTTLLTGYMLARRHRDQAQQQTRERLEEQVATRTHELSDAISRLKNEVQERRNAEQALMMFRWLADSADQGLGIANFELQVIYMNGSLKRMVGDERWQAGDRRDVLDYYAPASRERLETEVLPALREHGKWSGVLALGSDSRQPGRLMMESLFVIRDDQDQPLFFANVITDITEQRQLEAQLETAKDRAEQANRAKSMFLANMSHEIRTPLNAVIGYAQLLGEDRSLPASVRDRVAAIFDAGQRLLTLINDVLDVSKIESGRVSVNPERFDLQTEIKDLGRLFQQRLQAKGLEWRADLQFDGAPHVLGDKGKLSQILINLIGNAVKFTDEGHVEIRARYQDQRLLIDVRDSGLGMAHEEIGELFVAFRQGTAGTRKGGTGLGLTLSRRLARLMGGDLSITSPAEGGTCASLWLPLESTGEREQTPTAAIDFGQLRLPAGSRCRALVVEDDPDSRNILGEALRRIGFDVDLAEHGADGWAQLQARAADIVFTDIRMPELDGVELLGLIRQHASLQALAVVAVSASSLEHEREHFIGQGFDDFVGKPFTLADIGASLSRVLPWYWDNPATQPAAETRPLKVRSPGQPVSAAALVLLEQLGTAAAQGNVGAVRIAITGLANQLDSQAEWPRIEAAARQYEFETLAQLTRSFLSRTQDEAL